MLKFWSFDTLTKRRRWVSNSSGIRRVDVHVSFDTLNILTGIPAFTLEENEFVLTSATRIITSFDGNTPSLNIAADLDDLSGTTLTSTDAGQSPANQLGTTNLYDAGGTLNDSNGPFALNGSGSVYVYLNDSVDGDPESTEGEIVWTFLIAEAV